MLPETRKSVYEFEDVRCFPREDNLPAFWIEMSGVSNCDGRYYISRDNSDVVVCEYIIKGKGTLNVNGHIYYPTAGDIYILPEGTVHEYYADKTDPWVKIFFNLQGTAVMGMLEAFGLQDKILFYNCDALYSLFEEIYESTKEMVSTEKIMQKCCGLFARLLLGLHQKEYKVVSASDEAQKVKEYIDRNIHRELKISEIAQYIFRSEVYVNRLFKNNYGITPYAYYIEQRISDAKALLKHTTMSVSEISERLGYPNSQYFSKQFHRIVGKTALQYRKQEEEEQSGRVQDN